MCLRMTLKYYRHASPNLAFVDFESWDWVGEMVAVNSAFCVTVRPGFGFHTHVTSWVLSHVPVALVL